MRESRLNENPASVLGSGCGRRNIETFVVAVTVGLGLTAGQQADAAVVFTAYETLGSVAGTGNVNNLPAAIASNGTVTGYQYTSSNVLKNYATGSTAAGFTLGVQLTGNSISGTGVTAGSFITNSFGGAIGVFGSNSTYIAGDLQAIFGGVVGLPQQPGTVANLGNGNYTPTPADPNIVVVPSLVTFSNLDPSLEYRVVIGSNRSTGGGKNTYYVITEPGNVGFGAGSFTNTSSTGTTISTSAFANDTVLVTGGTNTNGYVASFSNIKVGPDGSFTVRAYANQDQGSYLGSVILLEASSVPEPTGVAMLIGGVGFACSKRIRSGRRSA